MKNNKLIFLPLFVFLFFLSTALTAQTSMAHTLAMLDQGGYISPDHDIVKVYERVLNQLDKKFTENKQQIGDMTVYVTDALEKIRIVQSNLSVMVAINDIESPTQTYNIYVAYYLTYRENGYNHETAKRGLVSL